MSSSAPSVDPRAKEIRCTDDELVVVLADGHSIATPLAWFPAFFTLMQGPAQTSRSSAMARVSTGPPSMRTSASKACSVVQRVLSANPHASQQAVAADELTIAAFWSW